MFDTSVDNPSGSESCKRKLRQFLNVDKVGFAPFSAQMRRFAQADAKRWRQCARTEALFLPPTVEQWLRLSSASHPQAAYTLRPMDLVAGNRDQVRTFGDRQAPE